MGKTSTTQKTPPKNKATQGTDYRRTSPRGHKSSGEIEVNARKRGTGPVGRGGKMIASPPQSSSSSESSASEFEAESEEEEEDFDGLRGTKSAKMSTCDELVE